MQKESVYSSILKSIGYEPALKILEIEFYDGIRLQYLDVPKNIFKKLMDANSHGKFFLKNIKDKYRTIKIR
jgi:hypothetical protein